MALQVIAQHYSIIDMAGVGGPEYPMVATALWRLARRELRAGGREHTPWTTASRWA